MLDRPRLPGPKAIILQSYYPLLIIRVLERYSDKPVFHNVFGITGI
jgi:hypothetical protein